MSATEDWFGGDEPRTPEEARFIAVLRNHQEIWRAAGIEPAGTQVTARMVPLHLQVDVPQLPPHLVNLQVGYWQTGPRGTGIEAEWGNRYLLDSARPGNLEIFGLPAEPEELAEMASRWLAAQLKCSIDRSDWLDSTGQVIASRWALPDTGAGIGQEGSLPRRMRRRPADRVVRVR